MSSHLLGFEEQIVGKFFGDWCGIKNTLLLCRNELNILVKSKFPQETGKKKVHVIKFMWLFCQLWFILLLLLVYFLGGFWLLSFWTEARNLRASLTLICEAAWRKRVWSFYISESLGWRLYLSLVRKYRAPLQGSVHRSHSSSLLAMRWSCLFPSHASVFPDLSAGTSPLP